MKISAFEEVVDRPGYYVFYFDDELPDNTKEGWDYMAYNDNGLEFFIVEKRIDDYTLLVYSRSRLEESLEAEK